MTETLGLNGAIIAFSLFILWSCSLYLKDASIIDIFWAPGFGIIALTTFMSTKNPGPLGLLLTALTLLWSIRLGTHLSTRWIAHGRQEDRRYAAMRKNNGPSFGLRSLVTVFAFQGGLMWLISLPLQLGIKLGGETSFNMLTWIGCALFAIGFILEALADSQLKDFKSDPLNADKVMQNGVWAWSRHPNYFGNACLWWGLFLIAVPAPNVIWTAFCPALMTYLLLRVSGVTLLERHLTRSKPDYQLYRKSVSAFVPLPPKRNQHNHIDKS
jgi:steroid 5-alpha reductase family enzyme